MQVLHHQRESDTLLFNSFEGLSYGSIIIAHQKMFNPFTRSSTIGYMRKKILVNIQVWFKQNIPILLFTYLSKKFPNERYL